MNAADNTEKGLFKTIARPFVAGMLAILPLALTLAVILWLAEFVQGFLGPESIFGKLLGSIGFQFVPSEKIAYLIGLAVSLALIYFLGVLVEAGMKSRWQTLVDTVMRRVPLVSPIYNAAKQLIGMFGKQDHTELKAMSPVLCYFGGEGGTAVLALMPSPKIIHLNGHDYHAVLVPTAPVPFGGGLLYVPAHWVKQVDFAVDGLLNVYMSMGITSPDYLQAKPLPGSATGDSAKKPAA